MRVLKLTKKPKLSISHKISRLRRNLRLSLEFLHIIVKTIQVKRDNVTLVTEKRREERTLTISMDSVENTQLYF